jgi:hypothetical protein
LDRVEGLIDISRSFESEQGRGPDQYVIDVVLNLKMSEGPDEYVIDVVLNLNKVKDLIGM